MEDYEENQNLKSSIYFSTTAAIPTLYSKIMFYSCIHAKVSSFAEKLSQADFKGTTYTLIDNLSLGIYLFWKQDLDAWSSQASVKHDMSGPENTALQCY